MGHELDAEVAPEPDPTHGDLAATIFPEEEEFPDPPQDPTIVIGDLA